MSNIDKQALREAAEKASTDNHTQDEWFHYLRCSTPETVLALLDELEAKDAQIANLTAERDALREGEMGDAKHSNTRAAADIYFQLVEECEIPAGGSLVEYVSELRERAAADKGAAS
ncbi:ead/Ea22-like family protein [Enterobacter hormaechei]|nr:ead/Ea22-like family protein [Enterobacter hormaechei]EMC3976694.1 ead/Ea22-like family protein [Enterobacter hormaechei]EMD3872898.1 ead/Ea22-like family protein [Enterobacter hormaechei]